MSTQQKQNNRFSRKWVLLVLVTILFLGVVWLLDAQGIVKVSWATVIPIVFVIVGVVGTVGQWLLPLPFTSSTTDQESHYERKERLVLGITKSKGALVIYTKKNLRGKVVCLNTGFNPSVVPRSASNVIERNENGRVVFVASFSALEPGNYTAIIDGSESGTKVTVRANQKAIIDWRYV